MPGLFENLAEIDDTPRVQHRQASAVANKRVKDKFGPFLANATPGDLQQRLALVEDEIDQIVADTVAEYGGDAEKIGKAIRGGIEHLKEHQFKPKDAEDGDSEEAEEEVEKDQEEDAEASSFAKDKKKSSSVKEARRPKMCPYHSEVVDVAIGSGDPQAGYNAMASRAWGKNHCKGGYEGSCNFKPSMVTQKYWDDKKQEYLDRAEQRAVDTLPQVEVPSLEGDEPVMSEEPLPVDEGEGITDLNGELAEAPSAIGEGEAAPELAMAASTKVADGSNPPDGDSTVKRENLPTGDESALDGPSPKMDHKTWKPNSLNEDGNLPPVKTEGEGSPHPTDAQDVTDAPEWENYDNFLRDTDAVTEHGEELPSAGQSGDTSERNIDQPHTDTWSGTEGLAKPVASADPDTNPLRAIIKSQFGGFEPSATVESAIRDHESE